MKEVGQEFGEALAAVKRHQQRSRLSMLAGMLVGGPFVALGVLFAPLGLLLWIPGVILGGAVWKKLRPQSNNPLDTI